MGVTDETGKVAVATVESLKHQPLALALVIVNVMFLAAGVWTMKDVAESFRAREAQRGAFMTELLDRCLALNERERNNDAP